MGSAGQNGFHDTALAPGPGIVVGRSGASFGKIHYCSEAYWPHNTTLYVTDFKGNNPRFAYYFLSAIDFSRYNSGSAQPSLNRNYIYSIPVSFPEPIEQRAIAHILGALDDKIELNRQMNQTLEDIARALFKSWFVNFDPVRAKAAGEQPPGLAPHIADLFPDEFVESELGEIPKGWRVTDIYQVADVIYGAPFKSSLFNEEGVGTPLIRIRDLGTHNPKIFTPEVHPKGYLVQPGDLVVGMDGEFRAHLWRGPRAWLNQRLCCFKPKAGIPSAFIHYSIENPLQFFERSKTGTTVIHLGKFDIDTFRVLLPTDNVLAEFSLLVNSIDSRIVTTEMESRTLAALRDTLLPKLISGELRVPDAERIVGRYV